jgi:hypothetical protein
MIRDIFGTKLKVGDYISFPSGGDLEFSKVLKIKKSGYAFSLKLSCPLEFYTNYKGNTTSYKAQCSMNNLHQHNSYFYKILSDRNFIIVNGAVGDPIDDKLLYTRNKLKQLKKEENAENI